MMFVIRKATLADANRISHLIVPLTQKYVCPTCDESVHPILLDSMSGSNIKKYLSENYQYHVALNRDDGVVGVVGVRELTHLYHLFVSDHYQGQGLAKQLWEIAKSEAVSNGNKGRFTVNSALNAEKVYLNFGFSRMNGIRNRGGMIDIPMVLDESHLTEVI
ncbi:GNAT family N-acetyltransferase [Photobacterium sp. TY1-4]|uniref:GNAT family N-acetyltransferase n=1 Tax=Photobacterium sp. TY1-4 TaxID=2899122 RepID=UPI0021C03740|nr:GNAT family N-acetyltransferase [Photobacterium sp. TY1-4]UXI04346.1 GNAT family N-acetyltransferase [Photobacterium sp. TY1-4]